MTEEATAKAISPTAPKRRRIGRRIAFGFLLLLTFLTLDYFAYPYGLVGGRSSNHGANGVWLRYT